MNEETLIEKLIEIDVIDSKISSATHILAGSDILKKAIIRVGVNEQKITVLGERVDTKLFRPLPRKERTDEKSIELLFVGRQEPQKNLHGVISAVKILIFKGFRVQLSICGGGPQTEYSRALLTKEAKKFCNYLGAVKNSRLPQVLSGVDILVNPSFFEGFQIPLIEALACGVPVVTSNQEPGNKIISEETGALVNPSDPKDIARGILLVKSKLDEPIKRRELQRKCRHEALTKWDYRIISKREVEVYKRVLGLS